MSKPTTNYVTGLVLGTCLGILAAELSWWFLVGAGAGVALGIAAETLPHPPRTTPTPNTNPPTGRTEPMDPVKELQDLDEHLRQHKRQWEDDEALTDDYWHGFEVARRIVGDHLGAARQRRGW